MIAAVFAFEMLKLMNMTLLCFPHLDCLFRVPCVFVFLKYEIQKLLWCEITIKYTFPLPLIDSHFKPLHQASVFPKLDLRNTNHLICICQGNECKTAFTTRFGHFGYLVMPFGLTNDPPGFQALMNDVLWDMTNKFVFVYWDNILFFSQSVAAQYPTCPSCPFAIPGEQFIHQGWEIEVAHSHRMFPQFHHHELLSSNGSYGNRCHLLPRSAGHPPHKALYLGAAQNFETDLTPENLGQF